VRLRGLARGRGDRPRQARASREQQAFSLSSSS
jgi:hypothetical protein